MLDPHHDTVSYIKTSIRNLGSMPSLAHFMNFGTWLAYINSSQHHNLAKGYPDYDQNVSAILIKVITLIKLVL